MNKSTIQIALSITKWSTQRGWSDEEFWQAIELLRSNKEDDKQTTVEKLDSIPAIHSTTKDYPITLNAGHVAEVLGVSQRKAYDIMDQKDFPLVRIGKRKVVTKDAFFKWLERGITA